MQGGEKKEKINKELPGFGIEQTLCVGKQFGAVFVAQFTVIEK